MTCLTTFRISCNKDIRLEIRIIRGNIHYNLIDYFDDLYDINSISKII